MEKKTIEVPAFIADLPFLKGTSGSLSGYKTYITAGLGIITGLLMYLTGELTLGEFIAAAWVAAQAIFIRSGVKKVGDEAAEKTMKKLADVAKADKAPTVDREGATEALVTPEEALAAGNG